MTNIIKAISIDTIIAIITSIAIASYIAYYCEKRGYKFYLLIYMNISCILILNLTIWPYLIPVLHPTALTHPVTAPIWATLIASFALTIYHLKRREIYNAFLAMLLLLSDFAMLGLVSMLIICTS